MIVQEGDLQPAMVSTVPEGFWSSRIPMSQTHPGIGRRVETKDGKGEGFLEEILTVKAELQAFSLYPKGKDSLKKSIISCRLLNFVDLKSQKRFAFYVESFFQYLCSGLSQDRPRYHVYLH